MSGAQSIHVWNFWKLTAHACVNKDTSMKRIMDAENSTHVNQILVKMKELNPNVLTFLLQQETTKQDEDATASTDGVDLIAWFHQLLHQVAQRFHMDMLTTPRLAFLDRISSSTKISLCWSVQTYVMTIASVLDLNMVWSMVQLTSIKLEIASFKVARTFRIVSEVSIISISI